VNNTVAPACESDQAQVYHDRNIEIRTLRTAAQMILEISPEAARTLRHAARLLMKQQNHDLEAFANTARQKRLNRR
jgi:hypothetical protein